MSLRLYVMRHGPAEDRAASGRDEDRALTASGRDRVRSVAQLLQREGELPRRIVASPLVRARETAEIMAAVAGGAGWTGTVETERDLAPGRDLRAVVERLRRSAADAPVIVGHEPDLSALVDELLGEPMPLPMDKAMVVALEFGDDDGAETSATLRFIVDPRPPAIVHDRRA